MIHEQIPQDDTFGYMETAILIMMLSLFFVTTLLFISHLLNNKIIELNELNKEYFDTKVIRSKPYLISNIFVKKYTIYVT